VLYFRPIIHLIGQDGGLERFEGCMALTNLAVVRALPTFRSFLAFFQRPFAIPTRAG
jgi:hypothetical protein